MRRDLGFSSLGLQSVREEVLKCVECERSSGTALRNLIVTPSFGYSCWEKQLTFFAMSED